jgi:hypothetical protein
MIGIDPASSRELAAVLLALKQMDKTVVRVINQQTRAVVIPEWKKGLDSRSLTIPEKRILAATGKALVSGTQIKLRAGVGGKGLSGGLNSEDNRAIEFGANREAINTYTTRSRKGKGYKITRHTQRQLRWKRKQGPVYRTAVDLIPRVASLWTQTLVRVVFETFESRK